MTGMCTVVALMTGSWIMPSGVFASTMTMAAISATLTIQRVSCFFVFIIQFLLVIIPAFRRIQYNSGNIIAPLDSPCKIRINRL